MTLRCRVCEREQPLAPLAACPACGEPLDLHGGFVAPDRAATPLVRAPRLSELLGIELLLKREDASPARSYKDRIAAGAVAAAEAFGFETVCCASTGHLAAALAGRCAEAGLEPVVLCPSSDVPHVVAAAAGARVFGVGGSFDDCRMLVRDLQRFFPWGFVDGNLHALAAEGAKEIAHELVEQLGARFADAVVVPVASGTLLAKLAQGLDEASGERPRLYGAQADGSPPLAAAWTEDRPPSRVRPYTAVRSLAVGHPAYGELALGAARMSGGAIVAVAEEEVGSLTSFLAETTGIEADPAAGVALGALLELVRTGRIERGERVVLVVTGGGARTPAPVARAIATDVHSDVESFLAALGVG